MNAVTQPTTRALKPIEEVRGALEKMAPQFKMALPSHIAPEKFQRVAVTAINSNNDLLKADRPSLYAACMKAAQDGLLPDGRDAALVTFGSVVQYMPMVAGILKKIRNSGELASIHAAVVYENDAFDYFVDSDGQHIMHRPVLFGERGKPIGVYAMAKTKDGGLYIEPMAMAEVEKIRAVSRSASKGPWASWPDEMAKKSAIRRLAKRLPQSTDLEAMLDADKELFTPDENAKPVIDQTTGEVIEQAQPKQRRSRVKAAVAEATTEQQNEMPPIPQNMQRHQAQPEMPFDQPPAGHPANEPAQDAEYEDVI